MPSGVLEARRSGSTIYGLDLSQAGSAGDACRGGGGGGGGGRGTGGGAIGALGCSVASIVQQRTDTTTAQCAAAVSGAAGRDITWPASSIDSRHVTPGCMKSQAGGDGTGVSTSKTRDDEAKAAAAKNLRDPTIHQTIQKAIKEATGVTVSIATIADACEKAAKEVEQATVTRDGTTPKNGEEAAVNDPVSETIIVDGDATDQSDAAAGGALGNVLMHEGLHAVFDALGLASGPNGGDDHHDLMDGVAGLTWRCALTTPGECSANRCDPDSPCASACTTTSMAGAELAGCHMEARGSAPGLGGTGVVDPSPVKPPKSGADFLACFDALHGLEGVSPACMAMDCGEGRVPTEGANGICTCGNAGGVLVPKTPAAKCGAMDCGGSLPTSGPFGCTCAPQPGRSQGRTFKDRIGPLVRPR